MISNTGNILERLRKMTEAIQKRSLKIAFLGYTDIMLSDAEWRALGVNPRQLADRPNGDLLRSETYHNRSDVSVTPGLTTAVNAVLHHECNITVFDFVKHEGSEVAWDFNLPIGEQWHQKFDVIIGMYHDQVLGPVKTLFEYDAINITLGLPFLRVTPDHGPNEKMIGKNKSSPISLIKALNFLDQR